MKALSLSPISLIISDSSNYSMRLITAETLSTYLIATFTIPLIVHIMELHHHFLITVKSEPTQHLKPPLDRSADRCALTNELPIICKLTGAITEISHPIMYSNSVPWVLAKEEKVNNFSHSIGSKLISWLYVNRSLIFAPSNRSHPEQQQPEITGTTRACHPIHIVPLPLNNGSVLHDDYKISLLNRPTHYPRRFWNVL